MVKQKMNRCKDEPQKEELSSKYASLNKEVKKSARKDKRQFHDILATEAEQADGR